MNPLGLPEPYVIPVIILVLSAILIPVAGWQIEVCTRNVDDGRLFFDFPFFLGGEVNVWFARDVWYAVGGLGWILGVLSGYKLGSTYIYRKMVKKYEDKQGVGREDKAVQ